MAQNVDKREQKRNVSAHITVDAARIVLMETARGHMSASGNI